MIKEAYYIGMKTYLEKVGMSTKPVTGAINKVTSAANTIYRPSTFSGVVVPPGVGATVGTMPKPALPKTSLKVKGWN